MNFNSSQFEKTGVSFCKYILLYKIFSMIHVICGVRDSFNASCQEMCAKLWQSAVFDIVNPVAISWCLINIHTNDQLPLFIYASTLTTVTFSDYRLVNLIRQFLFSVRDTELYYE